MNLSDLTKELPLVPLRGNDPFRVPREIREITADPARAGRDVLFVATRTPLLSGRNWVHTAYRQGCRAFITTHEPALPPDAAVLLTGEPKKMLAFLAARLYGFPSAGMQVFGVCGTLGKTTAILMAEQILLQNGVRAGIVTPQLSRFEKCLIPGGDILPDGAEIQHVLGLLKNAGCGTVLMECGSYQFLHHAFDAVAFDGAVKIRYDFDDVESGVFRTEEECRRVFTRFPPVGVPILYRFGKGEEMIADNIIPATENGRPGRRFTVHTGGGERTVFLPVPGDFAVEDAMAAAGICRAAGLPEEDIFRVFPTLLPAGTLELLEARDGGMVFRDSAYRPRDLARALLALRSFAAGRLKVLFGSVGERAFFRRVPLSEAAGYADFVYLTADDPGTENPENICKELAAALPHGTEYLIIPDRARAIRRALADLCPGDVLLLAGKGLCSTQRIMGQKLPFDEKEQVLAAGGQLIW